jgi:hypothetical protein
MQRAAATYAAIFLTFDFGRRTNRLAIVAVIFFVSAG